MTDEQKTAINQSDEAAMVAMGKVGITSRQVAATLFAIRAMTGTEMADIIEAYDSGFKFAHLHRSKLWGW